MRFNNQPDIVVIITFLINLVMFFINIKLGSVIPMYVGGIISFAMITYWSIRRDGSVMLRRSLIVGSMGGFFYTFVDRIFVDGQIIKYLRGGDLRIYQTPVSTILIWMYFIVILLYIYQRLRGYFSTTYIPSLLAGSVAFVLAFIFNYFGDRSRLWVWNANLTNMPFIMTVPLFVPLAFYITFFLSPYILGTEGIVPSPGDTFWSRYIKAANNPIVGGIRCAIMLSVSLFALLQIFLRLLP